MPFSVGPMELVIVLALALLVLGPKRLPEAGKSLGKGMREFKNSIAGMAGNDDEDEERSVLTASTAATTTAPAPTPAPVHVDAK
jgi:sec-independent protein translocase protein TatA